MFRRRSFKKRSFRGRRKTSYKKLAYKRRSFRRRSFKKRGSSSIPGLRYYQGKYYLPAELSQLKRGIGLMKRHFKGFSKGAALSFKRSSMSMGDKRARTIQGYARRYRSIKAQAHASVVNQQND